MIKPISLGILITAKDNFSSVIKDANSKLANFQTKIQSIGTSMMKVGAGSAAMGAAIATPLKSFYSDYADVAKKEGELESLKISAKGIEAITNEAKKFTNQFARISTPEFIKSAYDIKSGIETLSDEGVAKMTAMFSMTSQATKSTGEDMSKLFALGYGIFAKDFGGDFDFAEKFSAAISTSVQLFRTDGADLALGLSNIGASAKKMGVSLQEELAVVGIGKKVFNSASEAGTGYRAFLNGVGSAQEKLGLKFTNSKGMMLPIVEILNKIKGKYKDLKKVETSDLLVDAFGGDEAARFISGLIDKTDELSKAQGQLSENMKIGADVTKEMADKMNKGYGVELMTNRLVNLTSTIGSYLQPVVERITSKIGDVAIKATEWIENNKELATTIITVTGYIGGALLAFGTFGVTMGAISFAIPSIISGIGLVTTAVGLLGKSFLLNPIGLAITAIAIGATLIYTYWGQIKSIFSSGITFIQEYLGWTPLGMIINNWTPITGFFSNLWNGIRDTFIVAATSLKEPFIAVFDWFTEKFQWLETKVLSVVSSSKDFFSGVGDKIGGSLKEASSFFTLDGGYKKETTLNPVEPIKLDNQNASINKSQNVNIQKIEINNPASTAEVEKGVAAGLKSNATSLSDKEF